jgi:hypothetical protein
MWFADQVELCCLESIVCRDLQYFIHLARLSAHLNFDLSIGKHSDDPVGFSEDVVLPFVFAEWSVLLWDVLVADHFTHPHKVDFLASLLLGLGQFTSFTNA